MTEQRINAYEGLFLFPQAVGGELQFAVDHIREILAKLGLLVRQAKTSCDIRDGKEPGIEIAVRVVGIPEEFTYLLLLGASALLFLRRLLLGHLNIETCEFWELCLFGRARDNALWRLIFFWTGNDGEFLGHLFLYFLFFLDRHEKLTLNLEAFTRCLAANNCAIRLVPQCFRHGDRPRFAALENVRY